MAQLSVGGTSPISNNDQLSVEKTQSMSNSSFDVINGSSAAIGRRGGSGPRRMSLAAADVSQFGVSNFQPELYLEYNMDDDSPESITGIRKSLEMSRDKAMHDLQKTVHHRYKDFVKVTKELSGFESKMNELHGIINKLSGLSEVLLANVPQTIETAANTDDEMAASTDLFRPSAGMFENGPPVDLAERRAKINTLLNHVSDADDLLAESTGRYILFEAADLQFRVERLSKSIYLYLLNDSIMATSRRASKNPMSSSAKHKHSVDFFIPFSDFSYEDVKESPQDSPQFAIGLYRAGKKDLIGYVLFASATDKKLWLDQIKKAVIGQKMEEAAKNATINVAPVKERFVKKAARSNLGHRRIASSSSHRKAADTISAAASPDIPEDKHKQLLYLLDDLDKASFTRKYDSATELVDQLTFNLDQLRQSYKESPTIHRLGKNLAAKKRQLSDLLLQEISSHFISRSQAIHFIQLLTVLGYSEMARERFLSARSDLLHQVIKGHEINIDTYKTAAELSSAVISSIKTTAEWYRAAFNDHIRLSGLVFWIRLEIVDFCNLLVKLLFQSNLEPSIFSSTISDIRTKVAVLEDLGLDFSFQFDDCFVQPLLAYFEEKIAEPKEFIKRIVAEEDFSSVITKDGMQVAKSAVDCSTVISEFLESIEPILTGSLIEILPSQIESLLELALKSYLDRFYSVGSNAIQNHSIVTACEYLADIYFGKLYDSMVERYQKDWPLLQKLQLRLMSSLYAMYDILTEHSASKWLPMDWSCYESTEPLREDEAHISNWIIQMLPQMTRLTKEAPFSRRKHLVTHLTQTIFSDFVKTIDSRTIRFTLSGIEQLHLDTSFLLQALQPQVNIKLSQIVSTITHRAMALSEILTTSKPLDWFGDQAEKLLVAAGPAIINFGLSEEP